MNWAVVKYLQHFFDQKSPPTPILFLMVSMLRCLGPTLISAIVTCIYLEMDSPWQSQHV